MKLILVAGARPNFMKIAPLMRAIDKHNASSEGSSIDHILVRTGQHYDYEMSKIFFEDLELPQPHIYLGIGSGTQAEQTGRIMIAFEKVLFREKPDLVMVVGDVNSTLAAALTAVKLHIPIAHVEAGERTYDQTMPEEINRLLTDLVSEYLFVATREAAKNLEREGLSQEKFFFVGNIMADSLFVSREKATQRQTLSKLGLEKGNYALLTLHRPDNVDDKSTLLRLISAISNVSKQIPVIFPAHPRTQKNINQFGLDNYFTRLDFSQPAIDKGIYLTNPLGYLDFLNLEMNSRFVMTDSGGIQAETTMLNIPCLTLYPVTGWIVTLTEGTNTLVGTEPVKIIEEARRILNGKGKKGNYPELWDGKTAERIINTLGMLAT
ncbi:non-hydrolyzing UDP-N-acetylglucosamine 2-epimerase [Chloroflexota bacterium]